jgi:hypothetical protein
LDSIAPLFVPDYLGRTHDFYRLYVMSVQLAEDRCENARAVQARGIREIAYRGEAPSGDLHKKIELVE